MGEQEAVAIIETYYHMVMYRPDGSIEKEIDVPRGSVVLGFDEMPDADITPGCVWIVDFQP